MYSFFKRNDDEEAFVISSGSLGQQLVTDIHEMPQVDVIYIFCGNKARHEQWAKEWPKIRGVFTSIKPICESLKKLVHEKEQYSIPMNFVSKQSLATTGKSEEKYLDALDSTYMYSVIFKNIILEIHDDDNQVEVLLACCREQNAPMDELDDFQRRYQQKSPVWWYTKEIFLYEMLNKALRTFDMKGMIKMGFFIRHLHLQLEQLHKEQSANFKKPFTVYDGQGLYEEDFQNLLNKKGGLLSFNSFLLTSKVRHVAERFAQHAMAKNLHTVGVIFIMTIDPIKISTSKIPYAVIDDHSAIPTEQEIMFTMHTVFRVDNIKPLETNNRLYEVQLTIAVDRDPELTHLTNYINEEIDGSGWYRMCKLMVKVGDFDQAEELYNDLLKKAFTDGDRYHIYHQLGCLKNYQGKYQEASKYYEESIRIKMKTKLEDDISLAPTFSNLGQVYENMGDYSKALEYYKKSLKRKEKALPLTRPDLASSYSNIGGVYSSMGDYSKALKYYEKSLKIKEKALPPTHPDLASSYWNIGDVYKKTHKYSKSLEYLEKALSIFQKALPSTHPHVKSTFDAIVDVKKKL